MRLLLCVLALLLGSIHPLLAQRDAAAVLKEMRQAIGEAALDGLKTFSATGSRTLTSPNGSRRVALEWLAMVPDHFLEIRRDSVDWHQSVWLFKSFKTQDGKFAIK